MSFDRVLLFGLPPCSWTKREYGPGV
jgi:hypothetical protein